MKTTTIQSVSKVTQFKRMVLLAAISLPVIGYSQLQNNGTLYIGNNSTVFLKTGNYGFGPLGKSKTKRTNSIGRLVLASGTTTSLASDTHNIDGYATFLGSIPYTLPLGDGILAPIIVEAADANGVTAAFYKSTPASITLLGNNVASVSNSEYWDLQGSNAKITLTWRAATTANLTTSNYTIVGYNTTTNVWDEIASTYVGTVTPTSGSIESNSEINFSTYRFLTIGSKGEPCAPLVASNNEMLTWDGLNWRKDNDDIVAAPTAENPVTIAEPYNNGSFTCNSIVLNNDITLSGTQFIDCVNEAGGVGKIIMASEASFVQRNNASDAPKIELNKKTRTDMRRYDYIYWGTPVSDNFLPQFAAAKASTATSAGAFDVFYQFVSGSQAPTGWQSVSSTSVGKGFISRIKQQLPFTNETNTDFINMKISGTANNGTINVAIKNNSASPNGQTSHNLIGNPYPSAIDVNKFLTANPDVDGSIYIWTASTAFVPTGGITNYTQADYLVYTRMGSTVVNPTTTTFDGKIASGQGFKVKSLVADGTALFNNCMRVNEGNTQFYKASSNIVVDRYKINMSGSNGVFSQILVGYTPEATLGYDRMYDATRNSVSTAKVYTFLDNTDTKLAINARPTFANTDKVSLGMSKNNSNPETFVFEITEKEGVFNTSDVNVYLHDKVLGTYHDFANGNYTLTTTDTAINDRFELVYQTEGQLSNPDFDGATTLVYLNNNTFKVNSTKTISAIAIYDMAGRLVSNFTSIDNTSFTSNFDKAQGVYIAKIKLVDGSIVNQKVINQ